MRNFIILFIIILVINSCKPQSKNKMAHKYTNDLINETSPYLLQHAHNPVNWHAWSKKTIELAQKENKPLLISIGYSACHWCHVMEHESFENVEIADFMNKHFICIKVDREERPDIDALYMSAVQLLTGSGGWPLNCFAMPNGDAFYGGTYFRPQQWLEVLKSVNFTYNEKKHLFERNVKELKKGIINSEITSFNAQANFSKETITQIINNWKQYFDNANGGLNRAPKFPMPNNYETLLQIGKFYNDSELTNFVELTLAKMAMGGIYDQIGGGFARYSTDEIWLVPHFEKMLYDNAQLVSLYSKAYKYSRKEIYKRIVYETLNFIDTEFSGENDNFYSSYDADSEGEEGTYYIWSIPQIEEALGDDANKIIDYYNLTQEGNFEGYNILSTTHENESEQISELKEKLLEARNKRQKPGLDDKTLTSWNALMIIGYLDAYTVFNEKYFLHKAEKNLNFILKNQLDDKLLLYRNYKNNTKSIQAFLDDYAILIEALIKMYQTTFNEKYIFKAKQLTEYTITHFYDNNSDYFFFTPDYQDDIILRKKELDDNVIPASNSVMAKNLFVLAKYYGNTNYAVKSEKMLQGIENKMLANPVYYSNWLQLYLWNVQPFYEIVVTGNNSDEVLNKLNKQYLPNVILAKATKNSKLPVTIGRFSTELKLYKCKNNTCDLPVNSISELDLN